MAMPGLRTQQTGTTPGLPGIPFCDTRVDAIDVSTYRDGANYIFEWLEGAPHLTIRNVRNRAGQSMDGVYNLATQDVRRLPANGAQFLTCNWNQAENGAAHCFRDKTATGAWSITGLTHLPRGVFWFDNALTINGTQLRDADGNRDLLTTLIAKGYITLKESGHDALIAPNFSTPALVCDGDYYPGNLCDKTGSASQFTEWTDAAGVSHRGLPIGNVALVTESGAQLSGWQIHGNVILGSTLATAAQTTVIHGSLTVGTNTPGSATTVQQGAPRSSCRRTATITTTRASVKRRRSRPAARQRRPCAGAVTADVDTRSWKRRPGGRLFSQCQRIGAPSVPPSGSTILTLAAALDHAITVLGLLIALDLTACGTTGHRAGNRRQLLAVAATHLVA